MELKRNNENNDNIEPGAGMNPGMQDPTQNDPGVNSYYENQSLTGPQYAGNSYGDNQYSDSQYGGTGTYTSGASTNSTMPGSVSPSSMDLNDELDRFLGETQTGASLNEAPTNQDGFYQGTNQPQNNYYNPGQYGPGAAYGGNNPNGNNYSYSNDPSTLRTWDAPPERKLTRQEFYKREVNRAYRDKINVSAIVIYATAIIGLILTSFIVKLVDQVNRMAEAIGAEGTGYTGESLWTSQIIITLVLISLGVFIQFAQNRFCALAGAILSGINLVGTFILYHKFNGYLVFIAFVYATTATFGFYREWKEYETTGSHRGV